MYSREINGSEYTFGVSGKLIRNVLVMYDRQTNTLWSQLIGKAVEGTLTDTELEFLPSWQTTWEDWKALHPDTLALKKGYFGDTDAYDRYYRSGQTGVIGETYIDERLYAKEFVIGVEQDGIAVAYPYSVLNDQPVVNDKIGKQLVLIVFDVHTGNGVVYNREINGQTLTFQLVNNENTLEDPLQLIDEQTGSEWDALSGTAVAGELTGKSLERVKSSHSFWFGWKDFYPDTRIYGLDE